MKKTDPRPLLVAAAAVLVVVGGWLVFRDTSGPSKTLEELRDEQKRDEAGPRGAGLVDADRERLPYDRIQDLPDWVAGRGMPGRKITAGEAAGVPDEVLQMAGLAFGKSAMAANTIEMKQRIQALVAMELSEEQQQKIVEYFEKSDNHAFKYHMMVAFRFMGDATMVDAVRAYYDVDPDMVSECLQWIAMRDPAAYGAFEDILREEIEPLRRENLISRAAFHGSVDAEPMLVRAFEAGVGTADRRAAVAALARCRGEEGRRRLDAVIEGDFEAAIYDPAGDQPRHEYLKDLRCHAVIGKLMFGDEHARRSLWDRARNARDDDMIAKYAREYIAVVQDSSLVGAVVDHMVQAGRVDTALFRYVEARAEPSQLADVQRLKGIANGKEMERRMANLLAKIR